MKRIYIKDKEDKFVLLKVMEILFILIVKIAVAFMAGYMDWIILMKIFSSVV